MSGPSSWPSDRRTLAHTGSFPTLVDWNRQCLSRVIRFVRYPDSRNQSERQETRVLIKGAFQKRHRVVEGGSHAFRGFLDTLEFAVSSKRGITKQIVTQSRASRGFQCEIEPPFVQTPPCQLSESTCRQKGKLVTDAS